MNSFNLSITRLFTLLKCFLCCAVLASASMSSAHAQSTTDAPSYAGFWNKANEAGWGLSIQQQGDNVFAAWYTYAADGSPTWFTISCKLIGNQCKDNLYTVTGKPLSAGLTNIGANASVAGSGIITFNSTSNLTFAYTVQGRTKTISDVLKFNFVPADKIPVCIQSTAARGGLTNYTDMWWGGTESSGWGLSLAHQGDIIFVAFYTYSDDRKAAWTVGLANKVAGTTATYSGDFSTPRTGTPYYDINGTDATTFPAPKTGSFTLTFPSGEAATLDYELAVGGSASASKGRVTLNRFAVASGATTSCGVGDAASSNTQTEIDQCATFDYTINNYYAYAVQNKSASGWQAVSQIDYYEIMPPRDFKGRAAIPVRYDIVNNFAELGIAKARKKVGEFEYTVINSGTIDTLGTEAFDKNEVFTGAIEQTKSTARRRPIGETKFPDFTIKAYVITSFGRNDVTVEFTGNEESVSLRKTNSSKGDVAACVVSTKSTLNYTTQFTPANKAPEPIKRSTCVQVNNGIFSKLGFLQSVEIQDGPNCSSPEHIRRYLIESNIKGENVSVVPE
jgi:hypothetical protein